MTGGDKLCRPRDKTSARRSRQRSEHHVDYNIDWHEIKYAFGIPNKATDDPFP